VDHFTRFMGEDDDIAKAIDQGYQHGMIRGRFFEAGYLVGQVSKILDELRTTPLTGDNNAQVVWSIAALTQVKELLKARRDELEARNARLK
jgi:hypothetical protein